MELAPLLGGLGHLPWWHEPPPPTDRRHSWACPRRTGFPGDWESYDGTFISVSAGATWMAFHSKQTQTTSHPEEVSIKDYPRLLSELTRSRRAIVSAFEIERRRIERDLHDGAQQYMVAASIKLGEARLEIPSSTLAGSLIAQAHNDVEQALTTLRNTVHGIAPQVLTDMGLEAAVRDLAGRFASVSVRCPSPLPPMPQGVATAGYFFVSEALTNAAKHAPGARVSVLIVSDEMLRITVTDDGPGGVSVKANHGLSGIRERLAAFGGTLRITSPPGGPTQVKAAMPVLLRRGESGIVTSAEEDFR